MVSMRQWLSEQVDETTGLPLAKANSRGRFSRAAQAAIAKAYADGMEFDEDREPEKASAPRERRVVAGGSTATIARVKAPEREYDFNEVRQWCSQVGISVGARGRIKGEILAQYDASNPVTPKAVKVVAEAPRVRSESVAYGLTKSDPDKPYLAVHSVAFETCAGCSNKIGWCNCDGGPRCPQWLNGGEVASLTKP